MMLLLGSIPTNFKLEKQKTKQKNSGSGKVCLTDIVSGERHVTKEKCKSYNMQNMDNREKRTKLFFFFECKLFL